MNRISRGVAGVIGLAMGASAISPPAIAAQNGPTQTPLPGARSAQHDAVSVVTVTLVTGDVVHLTTYRNHKQSAAVERGPAAAHGAYQVVERDKHLYVTPYAAMPYVARGLVDEKLFDVTELVAQGYDDAHAKALPLILEYATNPTNIAATKSLLTGPLPAAAHRERNLASIGSVAVGVSRPRLETFWEGIDDDRTGAAALAKPALGGHLRKVWLDAQTKVSLDVSVPQIGGPAAWAAGFDGAGMKVAVLDTGIDPTHPDVAGRIVETANFTEDPDFKDGHGHGTHTASTVAGDGTASSGKYKGVAPKAQLVIGKVLNNKGSGPTSAVIAGMEWAAARAKVVSMSLGGAVTDGTDPESEAVNRLSAQYGTLFVVAAGNAGTTEAVATPGAADAALTVGAVDKADVRASFSSRGPRLGDHAVKPEIVAPGVAIAAARAAGTWPDGPPGAKYVGMSGTSMATPHVAGAAVLLAQQHPTWTGQQLKAALTSTAKLVDAGTVYDQGTGRVDLARAVAQTVTASAGTLNMGRFLGPYGDNEPKRKAVTYRNDGDTAVTLDLGVAAKNKEGTAAPEEMLGVTPATLTVPAHGTADATVSYDPDTGDLGLYGGRLTATSPDGKTVLAAALGFEKELINTVTFKMIARDGRSTFGWGRAILFNNATGTYHFTWADTSKLEVRTGDYTLIAFVPTMDEPGAHEVDVTAFTRPEVTIAKDTEIVLDARAAKPVTLRTPKPTEMVEAGHSIYRSVGGHSLLVGAGAWDKLSVVPSDAPARGSMEYLVTSYREAPKIAMRIAGPDIALHPTYLNPTWMMSQRLDGHRKLPAVYVGAGRPDDYAGRDVRGKVVLVRYTAGLAIDDQVAAAAAAKAAFVAVLNSGPGVLRQHVAETAPLPTVELSQAEGADLLARLSQGKVMLDLVGIANSPYSYRFVLPFKQIPDGVDYTADATNTARVDVKTYALRDGHVGRYTTSVWRPYTERALAYVYQRPLGYQEERYFTANDTQYGQGFYTAQPPFEGWSGPFETFKPGSEVSRTWFRGVLRSGTSELYVPTSRTKDQFWLGFISVLDSEPQHYGPGPEASAARVYRNGELVATKNRGTGAFDIGVAEPATYRVELDVTKTQAGWRTSPEIYSAWTFKSERTSTEVAQSVLSSNWDLDLDWNNAAPAGRAFALRLTAGTQAGATPVPVKKVKVWASFDDGATWKKVAVDGANGLYTGSMWHPKLANTTGFVSLRTDITDVQGGRFEQTVMRAYALK